ncbi:response regulator receiver domain protein [Aeromicrobium marinum DSM 15272]|uniref:Response regulator receiver domain protein n=1 Tax=Aeromicrobium marinum DSM 15272 TaxID=585531 RepID=E2SAQ7_9ACTN|nr:response regulator transcription factor [Aeromicrobium marinum]EFQ83453.1 response regulator receiver domain protein [Aeromicrobium marinum DSM 15272]
MTDPVRVLLVDDQELVRTGFSMILATESDIEVVGEARDGAEAVQRVAELAPDVVLMDVQMPGTDGISATEQIVAAGGAPKVLILTTFDDDAHLFAALQAGASGFLLKNCPPDDLVQAIRLAAEGHSLLAPEVTQRVIARSTSRAAPEADGRLDELTERERDVLVLLARGHSNAEIAGELYVSAATVKSHVSHILAKLEVRDRVQAVILAFENGLMD